MNAIMWLAYGRGWKFTEDHKHKLSLAKEKYYETHINIPVNKGNS